MESIAPDENKSKKKRGEIGPNGLIFAMMKHGKEKWMTPEEFEAHVIYQREACRKSDAKNRDKRLAASRKRYNDNPEKMRQKARDARLANPEKALAQSRAQHAKNREKERAQANQWNKDNRARAKANFDRWKENNPEMVKAHARKWLSKNRDKINDYRKEKHANDPKFAMSIRCRNRLVYALKAKGFKKESKTSDMLGCSWEHLCAHLESKFLPDMSWDNRSLWHVDHIIPLASASTMEELMKLARWENLQPLWGPDNIAKSDKMPWELKIPVDEAS